MSAAVSSHYAEPFFKPHAADARRGPTGMVASDFHLGDTPDELAALQALQAVAGRGKLIEPLPAPQAIVSAWVTEVTARQAAGEASTILDHSALTYMLLKGVFDSPEHAGDKARVEAALGKSWQSLTGKVPATLTKRLPQSVLRAASSFERRFHAYAFETPLHPKNIREHLQILDGLRRDYVLMPQDVATVAVLGTLAWAAPYLVGGYLLGNAAGYKAVTALEWQYHFGFGHPPAWLKSFIRTSSLVPSSAKAAFERYWETHNLHHHSTFRESQFERFSVAGHAEKLKRKLGRTYPPNVVENFEKFDFGTGMAWHARLAFYLTPLAVATAATAAFGALTLPVFAGIATSSALLQWGSAVQHPSDHETREKALADAHPLHRLYLKTRLAGWNVMHHLVHHNYVKDDVNMNLNPGADILAGRQRRGGMREVLEMNHHRSL